MHGSVGLPGEWGCKAVPPAPGVASAKGDAPADFGHPSAVNYYHSQEGKGAKKDSESQACPSQGRFHMEPCSVVC